jgi:hypothetical protein
VSRFGLAVRSGGDLQAGRAAETRKKRRRSSNAKFILRREQKYSIVKRLETP